ncbi:tyrosine-type recombinase/integrase [Sphingomonas koreensis]
MTFGPAGIDSLTDGYLLDPQTPGLWIEENGKGVRTWRYRRQIQCCGEMLKRTLGRYPKFSIADAREWAAGFNSKIDAGLDPRAIELEEVERSRLTVAYAHERYMTAVHEGRASRAKRRNKPRTIVDKLKIYDRDVAPKLATRLILDITEEDLSRLVLAKGRTAPIRANRLAAELKVFFGWASSLRGKEIGLPANPAARLNDLKFPEAPRERKLSLDEIGWYLQALVPEPRHYQRGMLLLLLTAARISEVIFARREEYRNGIWTIPAGRVKNSRAHRIALGPWGQSLIQTNAEWVFPSERIDGPRAPCGWYKARDRVLKRMFQFAGAPIEQWGPHDLRRTARSNTKRFDVDFETAEAMLNHSKRGLERIYDGYELEDEKRAWFLTWEEEIVRIAREMGVAQILGAPMFEAQQPRFEPKLPAPRRRLATRGPGFPSRRARRRA